MVLRSICETALQHLSHFLLISSVDVDICPQNNQCDKDLGMPHSHIKRKHMSQHMRFWYLSHSGAMNAQMNLCKCKESTQPSLLAYMKVSIQGKKEGKDQESIQLSTTPDPGNQWESDNVTIRHHK